MTVYGSFSDFCRAEENNRARAGSTVKSNGRYDLNPAHFERRKVIAMLE